MALRAETEWIDVSAAWVFRADAPGRQRLLAELATRGFCLVRPESGLDAHTASQQPWEVAARLFGEPPELVERQPIAPVAGGRSFASSSEATPLHTDSQLYRGVPPQAQLMFCARAASDGGETLLVDTHALLEQVEATAPELFEALFTRARQIPFVFGDVLGPTVSWRGDCLVVTHSPQPPRDPVGQQLWQLLARVDATRVSVSASELLVVDNHRMLHGRTAFTGVERSFTRLLVWRAEPFSTHPRFEARARAEAESARRRGLGEAERRSLGLLGPQSGDTLRKRQIVLEMLRGVPPGVLAQRYSIPEPTLYAWRDEALSGMDAALSG